MKEERTAEKDEEESAGNLDDRKNARGEQACRLTRVAD